MAGWHRHVVAQPLCASCHLLTSTDGQRWPPHLHHWMQRRCACRAKLLRQPGLSAESAASALHVLTQYVEYTKRHSSYCNASYQVQHAASMWCHRSLHTTEKACIDGKFMRAACSLAPFADQINMLLDRDHEHHAIHLNHLLQSRPTRVRCSSAAFCRRIIHGCR
jgi:hypothetical protein